MYGNLRIPASVADPASNSEVRNRLVAAGYTVTDDLSWGTDTLFVIPASDDRFRAWIRGLGYPGDGLLYAEARLAVGYRKGDSWSAQETLFRAKVSQLVTNAALALDTSSMDIGDNDFVNLTEFEVFLAHGFLALVVAVTSLVVAIIDPPKSLFMRRHVGGDQGQALRP